MTVITTDRYTLYHGDCLDILPTLEAGSVDTVITDPPYGTTACAWDSVIPFEPMWSGIKNVVRSRAAVVLFGSQPFTSALVMSNPKWFRYEWIWEKEQGTNFLDAWRKPYKVHENVLVFSALSPNYNPIFTKGENYTNGVHHGTSVYNSFNDKQELKTHGRLPRSIQKFNREVGLHPTQKPVALLEYLIRTYTNEGDTVLDFTFGSCSTGVAAMNTGRRFIGVELDPTYFEIGHQRIANAAGHYTPTTKEKDSPQPALFW